MSTQFIRRGMIAAGIFAAIFTVWMVWPYLADVWTILRDKEAISRYLTEIGVWGPLVFVIILSLQVLTVIIPGQGLMVAAGYLYGFPQGVLLNVLGAVGASQLAFVISRHAGDGVVDRVIPQSILQRWHRIVRRQGMLFFIVSFWFPIIPSNITNYLAGQSPISFWRFFTANFVGRLPGLVLITMIGAYGFDFTAAQWVAVVGLAVIAVLVGRYVTTRLEGFYSTAAY